MTPRAEWTLVLCCVLCCVLCTLLASASAAGVDTERSAPPLDREGAVNVESGRVGRHLELDVAVGAGYELNPVVLYRNGARDASVVAHRFVLQPLASIALFDWLRFGVDVPLALQLGDTDAAGVVPPLAVGDARVSTKLRLLRAEDAFIDVALFLPVTAPTAAPLGALLDSGWSTTPMLAADLPLGVATVLLDVGFAWRPDARLLSTRVGSELVLRTGAFTDVVLAAVPVRLEASLSCATDARAPLSSTKTSPVEAMLGARLALGPSFEVSMSGGAGLVGGLGTPDLRAGVALRFAPRTHDRDDDGVPDETDQCRSEPEDKDGFDDEDGCPERDNDGDGIDDDKDACPRRAEDKDDWMDGDGCPEEDNDGDGSTDVDDECPNVAGPSEERPWAKVGCPAPDTDGDGVDDDRDRCRELPGPGEVNGCPISSTPPAPAAPPPAPAGGG